jgi:TetR/AcrR family transcriptional repressor of mexJK operon
MEQPVDKRVQQTRERLREAAHRLFIQQGYQPTSIEAILAEAGVSSKETFYRHYANKEALFVDVLNNLTMEQPGFVEKLAALPAPRDLPSLQQALTLLSHEIVAMMSQPGYLPLVRMVLTESSRFPQLSLLFFSTVTQRGIDLLMAFLQSAREYRAIADLDLEAVTRTLLGGLIGTVLMSVVIEGELNQPAILARVDANIEVVMRALTPSM